MGYIAFGEEFSTMGACGCGNKCGCRQPGLSEWYVDDDEDDDNAAPAQRASVPMTQGNRPTLGEAPPRLVLRPPSLLQPRTVPAWQQRAQENWSRSLPQLQLRPEFMPRPGMSSTLPALPSQRPLDLRLSPEYLRQLRERWQREQEQERIRRMLTTPPPPVQRPSLGVAIRRYVDTNLDNLMRNLRIPHALRGRLRDAARDALGRGTLEVMNQALEAAGIRGETKEAISTSVRAAMEQIRVP